MAERGGNPCSLLSFLDLVDLFIILLSDLFQSAHDQHVRYYAIHHAKFHHPFSRVGSGASSTSSAGDSKQILSVLLQSWTWDFLSPICEALVQSWTASLTKYPRMGMKAFYYLRICKNPLRRKVANS